jgi:hypothetical protein
MVVMAAGLGLGMMPIMTGGLSTLPSDSTDTGSALNTLVQPVSSALGLAVLTALVTDYNAQFMADRSALLETDGTSVHPHLLQMQEQGQSGLLPMWQQTSLQIQAQAYSSAFFVAGCVTLAGAFLALLLRSGRPSAAGEKPAIR